VNSSLEGLLPSLEYLLPGFSGAKAGEKAAEAIPNPVDLGAKAADSFRKGLGIDPAEWKKAFAQTGKDIGVYLVLGILLALGVWGLLSAAGKA